ncbi:recombinase family protein [Sporosarcina sp. resist]|uniref:recombinase family protein n=1 Tax=Sporosarcina sp. resist TaxID=2762563 RepID=UPI00164DB24B|nr:recombinase family protein [Sporosarcina sp. resist]QNK88695.1 recombinase family protein [Sporosarcina sp. resist]
MKNRKEFNLIKTLNAVAYLRYSDKKQDGNNSLAIQKSQIQQLAERENLEIIEWRADKATSAFHNNVSKREGIQLLLEDIANGAEAVCFYEESRITRSITDFYNEIYIPIKQQYPHVKFFSTQSEGEWNPDDPMVQAKLVFAAEESEIKSVRTTDAQKNLLNREQPKRPGSRTPAGYDMQDGVLYPNEDAEIVELIYHLASWGHSHAIIAEFLNKCAVTSAKVKYWNSSTIGYILSNRAYSGNLAWGVRTSYEISKPKPEKDIEIFKNIHSPIISPTVIHLVKQINDLKGHYGTMNTPFYLRSIIKCKSCNSYLTAKDQSPKGKRGEYRIYRCTECKNSVSIIPVHQSVLSDLQKKWSTQLDTFITTSKHQLKQWSFKLRKTMDNLKQQLKLVFLNERTLEDDIANSPLLSEVFLSTKNHLQEKITYISETIDEINLLLEDDYLLVTLKEMLKHSFYDFADTELRVFFLIFFEEVAINFEKNNEIHISYRLSPFVSLENATGYVTEQMG